MRSGRRRREERQVKVGGEAGEGGKNCGLRRDERQVEEAGGAG